NGRSATSRGCSDTRIPPISRAPFTAGPGSRRGRSVASDPAKRSAIPRREHVASARRNDSRARPFDAVGDARRPGTAWRAYSPPMGRGRSGPPRGQGASRLAWRFLLPALAAIGGTLFAAVPWLVWTLERDQIATLVTRLQGEAREASSTLPGTRGPDLDRACAELSARLGTRITVVAPDGTVLGESSQPSEALQNHADRPEIRAALGGGGGPGGRRGATPGPRLP